MHAGDDLRSAVTSSHVSDAPVHAPITVRSIQAQLTHRDLVQEIMYQWFTIALLLHVCAEHGYRNAMVDPGDCLWAVPNPEIRKPSHNIKTRNTSTN